MIKPLRKRHLQIWSALLVLIPTGIVGAWLSVQKPRPGMLLQPALEQALSKIISFAEKENFTARLRGNGLGARQLEWINKHELTVPSAVIYRTAANSSGSVSLKSFSPASAELIGRIEARGTYCFPLKPDSSSRQSQFILYDFIHEQIIDSINLQP